MWYEITCDFCGSLGGSVDEDNSRRRSEAHKAVCKGLRPEMLEAAKQYLICQQRGHEPSNTRTASNPPQDICQHCGTYYWWQVERTLHEGMGKPTETVIAAAKAQS